MEEKIKPVFHVGDIVADKYGKMSIVNHTFSDLNNGMTMLVDDFQWNQDWRQHADVAKDLVRSCKIVRCSDYSLVMKAQKEVPIKKRWYNIF